MAGGRLAQGEPCLQVKYRCTLLSSSSLIISQMTLSLSQLQSAPRAYTIAMASLKMLPVISSTEAGLLYRKNVIIRLPVPLPSVSG